MRVIIKRHEESGLWVCSDGRVIMPPSGTKYKKFRFTFGCPDKRGYLQIRFRGKQYRVHCLIAKTFIPNPLNLPTVDHINRIKSANFVENLRWADYKLQSNNRQVCEDCLEKYGLRQCDDYNAYRRACCAADPEYAERIKARRREKRRKYRAKQKALGRRKRKCPDGKEHWLTDSEYDARFGMNRQLPLF